ncbi:MAG: RNA polymerase sigma factor [Acidobacteriia bacterium]|nr:RNA polymerase sigma factor [Terriglobia bacterium]
MVSPQSDEDLVAKTLSGEEAAFSQLYDRYRQRIHSTVYRIILDAAEAQDATQEVFIKLYRSLSDWNPRRARFSTWLYRMAANHAIDCWRSRRRRKESQPAEASDREALPEHPIGDAILTPLGALEKKESVAQIRRCVDDLPELQKKVFLLRYFQDLKLEEIAEMEDCSLGTVKTSLFRATHSVRRAVRKAGGSG